MRKAILLAIATILLMATATAAWNATTVDINGGRDSQTATAIDETEDGVQCVPDDGNFTIKIRTALPIATSVRVVFTGPSSDCNHCGSVTGVDGNGIGLDTDGNVALDVFNGMADITVAAPTTEGLHRLCVVDNNGIDTNWVCEYVGIKPDSTYTKYTITNTDGNGFCKTTDYSSFKGKIEDKTGYGRIEIAPEGSFDLSADISFDSTITYDNENKFTVSGLGVVQDRPVKVTFLKPRFPSGQFEVRRNDSGCSICQNIKSSNGQVSFTTRQPASAHTRL
jgi:hypothetical protein